MSAALLLRRRCVARASDSCGCFSAATQPQCFQWLAVPLKPGGQPAQPVVVHRPTTTGSSSRTRSPAAKARRASIVRPLQACSLCATSEEEAAVVAQLRWRQAQRVRLRQVVSNMRRRSVDRHVLPLQHEHPNKTV